jgi:hypothetical protein
MSIIAKRPGISKGRPREAPHFKIMKCTPLSVNWRLADGSLTVQTPTWKPWTRTASNSGLVRWEWSCVVPSGAGALHRLGMAPDYGQNRGTVLGRDGMGTAVRAVVHIPRIDHAGFVRIRTLDQIDKFVAHVTV